MQHYLELQGLHEGNPDPSLPLKGSRTTVSPLRPFENLNKAMVFVKLIDRVQAPNNAASSLSSHLKPHPNSSLNFPIQLTKASKSRTHITVSTASEKSSQNKARPTGDHNNRGPVLVSPKQQAGRSPILTWTPFPITHPITLSSFSSR